MDGKYIIKIGRVCPTDCTLSLNDKEYAIESLAWMLLSILSEESNPCQKLLKIIYENFNEDLV
jgi:hypothetical protein